MSQLRVPIMIVGAGPVGLALALCLEYWGVPCTIVNIGTQARKSPKGNTNNARTMEIFRQIGIVDAIRSCGLPADHPCDACFFTRFTKHEIHRHRMPSLNQRLEARESVPATDQYVEPMYRANHMYIEECLFEKVVNSESIEKWFGYEVTGFSQTDATVTVRASRIEDGESLTFISDYVVDCSGGRSIIRKGLNIGYIGDVQTKDAYMAGRFLNAWVRIPTLYDVAPALRTAWFTLTINADKGTRGILAAMNGKDEFVLITKESDSSSDTTAEDVIAMIRKMIGDDEIPIEVLSHVPWKAGAALVAERYREGRVLLAGDSSHLFTPVGGFGMNTGIDDAHNLAWKLAAVCKGWGGQKLLDSYEVERQQIGFRNTNTCRKLSTAWKDPIIEDMLETDGSQGDEARARAAKQEYVANMHFNVPEQDDWTGIQLGSRYDASPVIVPDGEPPVDSWPDSYATYKSSSVPGGRLPHLWLQENHVPGASIYDRLGRGFTLLRIPASSSDAAHLLSVAQAKNIPLDVVDIEPEAEADARALYGKPLLLVRPDRYIAWRGDSLPEDCDKLLERICGLL